MNDTLPPKASSKGLKNSEKVLNSDNLRVIGRSSAKDEAAQKAAISSGSKPQSAKTRPASPRLAKITEWPWLGTLPVPKLTQPNAQRAAAEEPHRSEIWASANHSDLLRSLFAGESRYIAGANFPFEAFAVAAQTLRQPSLLILPDEELLELWRKHFTQLDLNVGLASHPEEDADIYLSSAEPGTVARFLISKSRSGLACIAVVGAHLALESGSALPIAYRGLANLIGTLPIPKWIHVGQSHEEKVEELALSYKFSRSDVWRAKTSIPYSTELRSLPSQYLGLQHQDQLLLHIANQRGTSLVVCSDESMVDSYFAALKARRISVSRAHAGCGRQELSLLKQQLESDSAGILLIPELWAIDAAREGLYSPQLQEIWSILSARRSFDQLYLLRLPLSTEPWLGPQEWLRAGAQIYLQYARAQRPVLQALLAGMRPPENACRRGIQLWQSKGDLDWAEWLRLARLGPPVAQTMRTLLLQLGILERHQSSLRFCMASEDAQLELEQSLAELYEVNELLQSELDHYLGEFARAECLSETAANLYELDELVEICGHCDLCRRSSSTQTHITQSGTAQDSTTAVSDDASLKRRGPARLFSIVDEPQRLAALHDSEEESSLETELNRSGDLSS